jgi:hypothetical protein
MRRRPDVRLSVADYEAEDRSGHRLLRWTDRFSVVRLWGGRYVVDKRLQEALVERARRLWPEEVGDAGHTRLAPVAFYPAPLDEHVKVQMQCWSASGLQCAGDHYRMITASEAARLRERGHDVAWPPPDDWAPVIYRVGTAIRLVRQAGDTRVHGTERVRCYPAACEHYAARRCRLVALFWFRLPLEGGPRDCLFASTSWRTAEGIRAGLEAAEEVLRRASVAFPDFYRLPQAVREAIIAQAGAVLPARLRLYQARARFAAQSGAIATTEVPVVALELAASDEECLELARAEIARYLEVVAALRQAMDAALAAIGQPCELPTDLADAEQRALAEEFRLPSPSAEVVGQEPQQTPPMLPLGDQEEEDQP